jgi:serine/threonine protein kinase
MICFLLFNRLLLRFYQDNVLVSDDGVALINDFGMSRILNVRGFTTRILRNIRFNAPELMPISEQPTDIHPTFESDIFSLGMLFLQVFFILFLYDRDPNLCETFCFIVIQWIRRRSTEELAIQSCPPSQWHCLRSRALAPYT